MVANDLLMQFQADSSACRSCARSVAETTALGAAYAAGLAVGFWSDLDELRQNWQADKTWQPDGDEATRARLYHDWKRAVERTLGWVEEGSEVRSATIAGIAQEGDGV